MLTLYSPDLVTSQEEYLLALRTRDQLAQSSLPEARTLNTASVAKTLIVLIAVPFSAVGAIWLLHLLDYNLSVAVWVGLIALLGVDAETGMFMLLYLDLAYQERREKGLMRNWEDLKQAVIASAVQRLRPKVMTVSVMFIGLTPIMWSHGTGADVMKRIAAPMIGGIFTSFVLELVVYPAVFALWKWRAEVKPAVRSAAGSQQAEPVGPSQRA